jgi:hypothetical protein
MVTQSTAHNFNEFPTRSSFRDSVGAQIVVSLSVRFCFGESFYFFARPLAPVAASSLHSI